MHVNAPLPPPDRPTLLQRVRELGAPNLPPMVCRMVFDELCVLASGEIVCSCGDPAGLRVYGNVRRDRIADVYGGPLYREMRAWQLASRPDSYCPVIGTSCGGRVSRATASDRPEGRAVRTLQLEPISLCNLRCPVCPSTRMHIDPAYRVDRAAILPLPVMLDVLDQLPDLEKLLFYNFGEPFLHREALPFLREVRRRRPDVVVHTSTNGLVLDDAKIEAIVSEGLADRVVFSIDGAREESYRRYRVNGVLAKALLALESMAGQAARSTARPVEVHWQYILFEWNDSDEELAEARRLAGEIGVPLKWVLTHTKGASTRYRDGSEATKRLLAGGDPYAALTCDARMHHLWRSGGVASGKYLASLALEHPLGSLPTGGRALAVLRVTNRSRSRWDDAGGRRYRIGLLLRTQTGRPLVELPGVPLPEEAREPGGSGAVLVDLRLPEAPGRYELLADVVEDRVCWFSERSSPPLVVPLDVTPRAEPVSSVELAARLYRAVLSRSPEPEGLAHWASALEAGSIEASLRDFVAAARRERPDLDVDLSGLRAALAGPDPVTRSPSGARKPDSVVRRDQRRPSEGRGDGTMGFGRAG